MKETGISIQEWTKYNHGTNNKSTEYYWVYQLHGVTEFKSLRTFNTRSDCVFNAKQWVNLFDCGIL